MADRSSGKPAKPATAPTNLSAGALASLASRGHLDHGKRYARAAQAPTLALHPDLVPSGLNASSTCGDVDRPWWPGRFVTVLDLGSRLNSSERYGRADQVLSVTPHSLLPDALRGLLPPLRRHAPAAQVLSRTRRASLAPGSLLEPEARDA